VHRHLFRHSLIDRDKERIVAEAIQISTGSAICSELVTGMGLRSGIKCVQTGVDFASEKSPKKKASRKS
jgi:hypothetical protein